MKLRIQVQTQLKVQSWKEYLDCYWDKQLIDLIAFGFPLDFDRKVVLNSIEVNHNSALKFPEHVSKYIDEKKSNLELYWDLLNNCLFIAMYPPFLTREKPKSEIRRVILDLSFPVGKSANLGVPKDKYPSSYFELKYPSVDYIVHRLKQLGPLYALLYKIYINRALMHIRIEPGDLDLLGLKHGDYFIDGALPFGILSVLYGCSTVYHEREVPLSELMQLYR